MDGVRPLHLQDVVVALAEQPQQVGILLLLDVLLVRVLLVDDQDP
jgi:hypothetical protein